MTINNLMMKNALKPILWKFPYTARRYLVRTLMPQFYQRCQKIGNIKNDQVYTIMQFKEHRCIFVHIPKTAGFSMSKSLFGRRSRGHRPIYKYQLVLSKSEFENYFKFAFVRNPWDRLVSAFHFLQKGGIGYDDNLWAKKNLSLYSDFDSFVRGWVDRRNVNTWKYFVPQYKYVCEPGRSVPKVDFIGFFENLEEDYSYIQKRLGIDSNLWHINRTSGRKSDYRDYYTEVTRKIVANVYREDIQIFDYDFDNTSLEKQMKNRSK